MSLWLVIIFRVGRCLHGLWTGVTELVAAPAPRSPLSARAVVAASPLRGTAATRSRVRSTMASMIYEEQQRVYLSVLGWRRMIPLAAIAGRLRPTGAVRPRPPGTARDCRRETWRGVRPRGGSS